MQGTISYDELIFKNGVYYYNQNSPAFFNEHSFRYIHRCN